MILRPATAADIPDILALERSTPEAAHWSRGQYESALADSLTTYRICLLIESESQLDGFLVARQVDREWEVENLAVAVAKRRQGLGARLLAAFLQYARNRGGKIIFLEVRASNSAARALYEKGGFIHSGTRPGYYRDPDEDAALYSVSYL